MKKKTKKNMFPPKKESIVTPGMLGKSMMGAPVKGKPGKLFGMGKR